VADDKVRQFQPGRALPADTASDDQPVQEAQWDPLPTLPKPTVLTAAGIIILATLSAYGFWLWMLIQVLGLITEFQGRSFISVLQRGDFWDIVRIAIAIVGAGVLTFLSWVVAVGVADES
jgi:hypothetical protein